MDRRLLLLLLLAVPAVPVRADETAKPTAPAPPADATEEEAKEALEKFAKDFATEDLDYRLEAVKRLRRTSHPTVASRLTDVALKEPEVSVRTEAFRALASQKSSAKSFGPRVAAWLAEAARASAKAKARGDYGVRIDPKTGEADTESEEGKKALAAKRERGKMVAEAVRLLVAVDYRDRDSVEVLTDFLSDGNDDVVALALDTLGKWKTWTVLKEVRNLFEMYPDENSWETGSTSVDTGSAGSADQQAAKRAWMAKYGDPDKRRPRPKVVQAIHRFLVAVTGQDFEKPKDLAEFLKRPDVKRKVKG